MARAAALMATFGGDRVAPYGIDASGAYDVSSGEWQQPSLFGGGEYTRRRQVAVGFGVKMFVDDVSPSGVIAGRKLARDTAIVNGSGGEFSALRNGYAMAQRMAAVADLQHAVGGVRLEMVWAHAGRSRADRRRHVPPRCSGDRLDGQAGRLRARGAAVRHRHGRRTVGRCGRHASTAPATPPTTSPDGTPPS